MATQVTVEVPTNICQMLKRNRLSRNHWKVTLLGIAQIVPGQMVEEKKYLNDLISVSYMKMNAVIIIIIIAE